MNIFLKRFVFVTTFQISEISTGQIHPDEEKEQESKKKKSEEDGEAEEVKENEEDKKEDEETNENLSNLPLEEPIEQLDANDQPYHIVPINIQPVMELRTIEVSSLFHIQP